MSAPPVDDDRDLLLEEVRDTQEAYERFHEMRIDVILEALESGIPERVIADAAGISRGSVEWVKRRYRR